MICKRPPDDRIVLWGQSCVGKTTFAGRLAGHARLCFDALFPWHAIETLGLSTAAAMEHVRAACVGPRWVLDGWHLSDTAGAYLPAGASVYVVYAPYEQIIRQYRVPVGSSGDHRPMFLRWYRDPDFGRLPGVRYFRNTGEFAETSQEEFRNWLAGS